MDLKTKAIICCRLPTGSLTPGVLIMLHWEKIYTLLYHTGRAVRMIMLINFGKALWWKVCMPVQAREVFSNCLFMMRYVANSIVILQMVLVLLQEQLLKVCLVLCLMH